MTNFRTSLETMIVTIGLATTIACAPAKPNIDCSAQVNTVLEKLAIEQNLVDQSQRPEIALLDFKFKHGNTNIASGDYGTCIADEVQKRTNGRYELKFYSVLRDEKEDTITYGVKISPTLSNQEGKLKS